MKQLWKSGTLLSPLPAVPVSLGSMERPNIITVAWTGILCSDPPKTYISVRKERYSYELLKKYGQFVINLPTAPLIRKIDFCGVRSGKDIDKFKECGLTAEPSLSLECPSIAESPLCLECKINDIVPLGSHDMFIADIVAVNVDESIISNGKLCLEKAHLVSYAHGSYYALGKKIGTFGFSVKKKRKK